jgi:hypothetical protein
MLVTYVSESTGSITERKLGGERNVMVPLKVPIHSPFIAPRHTTDVLCNVYASQHYQQHPLYKANVLIGALFAD